MQATAEWLDVDFYDVLGVDKSATAKQIKSAYRKLARTAHPDANPDDTGAEARFSDIAKAYEVLSDGDTRSEYDQLRLQAQRPAPTFGAGRGDLNDLFGDFFATQQARPRRGIDVAAALTLDFIDAVNGRTTDLVVDGRPITVRIPAGVRDQQRIRLAGRGAPGLNGGPPGDLLIQITVRPHPTFGRSGKNLTTTVDVRYEDMVLGGDISVPTLGGPSVTVRVPAGSTNGQKLRVIGKGVPAVAQPGDLVVTVNVDVPNDASPDERALLEQLRTLRPDATR